MRRLYWLLVALFVSGRYVKTDYEVYSRPHLYMFVTTPETWERANTICVTKRAALVKINSVATKHLILNNFPTRSSQSAVWIGANDIAKENTWRWVSDASLVGTDSDWYDTQPDNWQDKENCATISRLGKWNDLFCSDSRIKRRFVCQRHIFTVDEYTLSFSYDLKTWSEARQECQKDGSYLAKIDSDSLMRATIQESGKNGWWIGASDLDSENDWKWLDGTSANRTSGIYQNWNTLEPNGKLAENCASALRNGKWNDLSCSKKRKYMCQKNMTIFTDTNKLFFSLDTKTWTEAKAECAKNGSHLMKINSASLTNVVLNNSIDGRWIGLSDTAVEGRWEWMDGNVATYQNWAYGHPRSDSRRGIDDCAYVAATGKWYSANCGHKMEFICQTNFPTSVMLNGHVFTFFRRGKVSWQAARDACVGRGSRLAEIHDQTTNLAIKGNIRHPHAEFYCGGTRNRGTITWDSGTIASYTAGWATGEPNSDQKSNIALTVAGWKDVSPSTKLPYICEKATLTQIRLSKTQHTTGVGSEEEVSCTADGIPFSEVVWNLSSTRVSLNSNDAVFQVKEDGRSVLHFRKATLMDEGVYTCSATNRAGNVRKALTAVFNLTVPSAPDFVIAEALECSTDINVRWRANARARNVNHKIVVKSFGNASERYKFSDHPNDTFTFRAKKWMLYNITVRPNPVGKPKTAYVTSNYTRRRTKGIPGKVRNFNLQLSNKYSCRLSWKNPREDPSEYIMNYTITIAERLYYSPVQSPIIERTSETVNTLNTTYIHHGKANFQYKFGIQAVTCAGLGEIIWRNDSCVTDSKAPDVVAKPHIPKAAVSDEGTMPATIPIPSREGGPISCIFVIVNVQQPGSNGSDSASLYAFTLDELIRLNNTNSTEYIALALDVSKESGNQSKIVLGDEKVTNCDASRTARRQKREAINNKFVGRNSKLDRHKTNEVFIVTATPTKGRVLFKASSSVKVDAVPAPNAIKVSKGSNSTGIIAAVAGGGAAVVIIIILAVIIVVVKRRKRSHVKDEPGRHSVLPVESQYEVAGGAPYRNAGTDEESPYAGIGDGPYEMTADVHYQNNRETVAVKKRTETDIPMQEFEKTYNAMHDNQGVAFTEQFEELKRRLMRVPLSVEFASNPELKSKNRYKNILPYDNTRVPIRHNNDGYINACFIDGFEQKKKYIAAQGPLSKTVNDFWLMIVEQKVTSIVMLAKCVEARKKKCEKYWPDIGNTSKYGLVTVSNINEARSCGFVCRTLNVKARLDSEYETVVSQYHFMTWPDHGFPLTTSHILRMHKQLMNSRTIDGSTSPIVVHCSAGAGRTGTFIGYDYLLNESKSVGNADVFECVAKMRSQRVEMVQNCDQYIMVHKLLLEIHSLRDTDISRQEVLQKFTDLHYKKRATSVEFANLSRIKPMDMTMKNSAQKLCAYDRMRVTLLEDGRDIAKKLQPSLVEAYDDSLKIIVAKQPSKTQVEILWALLFSQNITVIVMISENEHDSLAYWNDDSEREFDVHVHSEEMTSDFEIRKLRIRGPETKSVTHLHLKLDSSHATRKTVSKINACVDRLQKELRELHGVALIHCKSGTGMSGVFCAVMNILERLAVEDRVDVFRAVKDLRDCKEGMIETQEQYNLCFDAVLEYLRNFDTYSNFL